jgi:hypothetical protein
MPSISPLEECRRQCFADFNAAIKAAAEQYRANATACTDAFKVAVTNCASDPDPAACRARAEEVYTDCRKQSADLLVAAIDTARLQLENCLTMCVLQHGNR